MNPVKPNILKEINQSYFDVPRREMMEFVPEKIDSALEIGCGTGAFGNLIKKCDFADIQELK